MTKFNFILILFFLTSTLSFAQDCDCTSNFEWVKKTFEENDAGFEYALKVKGEQAYKEHNRRILVKVKAAKQSKKVKLFGITTYGVLDVSNMYFVPSPCNEFELGYSLSRSMRIPDFSIDGKGLQPDYYLDNSIPLYKWTQYVNEILNGR